MASLPLGQLRPIPLTQAWADGLDGFRHWLTEHLPSLEAVSGLPVTQSHAELDGPLVRITARSGAARVVILAELGPASHAALGCLVADFAEDVADHVIWIAGAFRPDLLAAAHWVNAGTGAGSCLAVRLQMMRIGESAAAPIFDVLERSGGAVAPRRAKPAATAAPPIPQAWPDLIEWLENTRKAYTEAAKELGKSS